MSIGVLRTIASETTPIERLFTTNDIHNIQVAQANPLRYSLAFSNPSSGSQIVCISPNPDGTIGIVVQAGPPTLLKLSDWGSLVQQAWFVFPGVLPLSMTVYELLFNRDS